MCDNAAPLSLKLALAVIGDDAVAAANPDDEDGGVVDELGEDVDDDI